MIFCVGCDNILWQSELTDKNKYALLAQLDRVFGYEPKGQGFESLTARQIRTITFVVVLIFLTCKGFERALGKHSGGMFLARRVNYSFRSPQATVVEHPEKYNTVVLTARQMRTITFVMVLIF